MRLCHALARGDAEWGGGNYTTLERNMETRGRSLGRTKMLTRPGREKVV